MVMHWTHRPTLIFSGVARVAEGMAGNTIADIRDADIFTAAMQAARPRWFSIWPLNRWCATRTRPGGNLRRQRHGTVNLLEAVRATPGVRAVVNVTTDKCTKTASGCGATAKTKPWAGMTPIPAARPAPSW